MPLFFGRLDYDADAGRRPGRDPLHRPPARDRRVGRRADGDRLAGRHVAAVLPGPPGEPMGVRRRRRFGFSHGRLTAYEDEDLAHAKALGGIRHPRVGDRAAPDRPDARHRRHHPAGAGHHRPGRTEPVTLRAGRARAPGRRRSGCTVRPTCCTRSVINWRDPASWWSARTTASCPTSATCCPRWARSTPPRRPSYPWCARQRYDDPRTRPGSGRVDQG